MSGVRIVDSHDFRISRYEDDSVDISCGRDSVDVDYHTAFMEASVICRSMAEELHQTEEVCSIRLYESGMVSTYYRTSPGVMRGWAQFRWLKERLHEAGYNGLLGLPVPPRWVVYGCWILEYLACRIASLLGGRSPHEGSVSAEPPEEDNTPLPENVVRLRPRT